VHASLEMFHKLLPKLKVISDISGKANASFVAATELANILVRKYDVPFRTAHKIVGALVKSLIERKLTFKEATPEFLQKMAKEVANIKLFVNAEEFEKLANPLKLVEACKVKGGPSPVEVKRALAEREKQLILTRDNISKMDRALDDAEKKLDEAGQFGFPESPRKRKT